MSCACQFLTRYLRNGDCPFEITSISRDAFHNRLQEVRRFVLRLDYISCVLTIVSTILVGKRCWEGWILAAVNSVIICIIGLRTSQLGFIPANVFCLVLYGVNLHNWRKAEPAD